MDISKIPYAAWLEESLRVLIESGSERICIAGMTEDGKVYTGYYNCNVSDKALFAHYIQTDAFMEEIRTNADMLREWIEEFDEEEE